MIRHFLHQIKVNRANGSSFQQLKYFLPWKRSQAATASSVKDEQPWITFEAIDYLDKVITAQSNVFEYGGGGSSLFFLKRAKKVITAEHDEKWFMQLQDLIQKKYPDKWTGLYIKPTQGDLLSAPDPSNPEHYSSADQPSKGFNYKDYAGSIDQYNDSYFDFVLVDGRSRPACIKHSINKIKKGGYLILDNSDRDYYLPFLLDAIKTSFHVRLNATGPCPYCREFTQTTIWQKK